MPEDVGVELPPRQFRDVSPGGLGVPAGEIGEQGARVDAAVLEVRRHPAGPVDTRGVPRPVVVVQPLVAEARPDGPRRGLPGGRQDDVGERGDRRCVVRADAGDPRNLVRTARRCAPPVLPPGPREGCEHPVRRPVGLGHAAGGDGVGRAGADQRDVAQRALDGVVPPSAVRTGVGGDVHAPGARLGDQPRDHPGGFAGAQDQRPAGLPAELREAVEQEAAARVAGGAPEPFVEHEDGERPCRQGRPSRGRPAAPGGHRAGGRAGTRARREAPPDCRKVQGRALRRSVEWGS